MSYTCLNYHIVFTTRQRKPLIDDSVNQRLFSYIAGIVGNMKSRLYIANGISDHIHLLVSLSTDVSVADCVRTIKTNSSRWMHQTFDEHKDFAWQEGYSAFSVSYSAIDGVVNYIKGQQEHHKKVSFNEELKVFLDKHKIEYNPEYLQ